MTALLDFDAAQARIATIGWPSLGAGTLASAAALGCVLAEPVVSPETLPAFDSSAIDGYALGSPMGGAWRLVGDSFAGAPHDGEVGTGEAVRIATGGKVPPGTWTIALQEHCTVEEGRVNPSPVPPAQAYIRHAGQDIASGQTLMPAGRRLGAPEIGMLAALGIDTVTARRPLRVALASTGDELKEASSAVRGLIRDSNRPMLQALLGAYPVTVSDLGILPDDRDFTRSALRRAAREADLIVTTGGVSVGLHDHVRETVETDGNVVFWRLAIKPGKPLLLGVLDGTPLLGLPGNPVSACVTFQLFCRPLLLHLLGVAARDPLRIPVRADFAYRKAAALREFVRVSIAREDGALVARPFRNQTSNLLSSLLESDGLLDLPAGIDELPPGGTFDFLPWSGFTA